GFFCLNFVIYFFLTWFPDYLKNARGLNLAELGTFGMIPGLTAVVAAWSAGAWADRAIRGGVDVTAIRKLIMVGGDLYGTDTAGHQFLGFFRRALCPGRR
ncbi:unnamed protein product, partial [marine sediment metagenome]